MWPFVATQGSELSDTAPERYETVYGHRYAVVPAWWMELVEVEGE